MGNSYVGLLNGQTFSADFVSANYIQKLFLDASTPLTIGGGYA
jgi:hypothetical protein